MDVTPPLVRQNAILCGTTVIFNIEMIRKCCCSEHEEKSMGPTNKVWFENIEKAIEQYCLWFHDIGHIIQNGDTPNCCQFKIKINKKMI